MEDYWAVRGGGAGLINLASRARLLVGGSEAAMFLNGLITNDVKALAVDSWMPAAFANVQGRLLASIRVIHRPDGFLIDTEAETHETVLRTLDRFTLAGDFRVTDVTNENVSLTIQGRNAERILQQALSKPVRIERRKLVNAEFASHFEVNIIRATHTAEDGFDLFADVNHLDDLRHCLLALGAHTVSAETSEVLRIEAGIPRYGIDMDETTVVTETNLDEAVSFSKGCYLGQEIIVRIKHRGHVAKKLTGIILEERATIAAGARVVSADDKEIGRVTSSAFSPQLERTVALAYVKYDYLEPGTSVKTFESEKQITATVAGLPLVRGSWSAASDL